MKLIFERSVKGRRTFQMPASTFPKRELPEALKPRAIPIGKPEQLALPG